MASPPPRERCVCGREWRDHYTILSLDRDAMYCSKYSGARYVPQSEAAGLIREQVKEIERLHAGLRHIAETCIQEPDIAQFAARLIDGSAEPPSVSASEKIPVQP